MMKRYPNFDLLRLLLALEVVFDHARYMANPKSTWNAPIVAVPAFLAISGFLVLKSYADSESWAAFIKKRALRLLPALGASMLLCLVLFDWFAVYNSFLNWITGGLYTLEGAANAPLWSLGWEELAYLSLALLWTAGAYRKPIIIWAMFAVSLVVVHYSAKLDSHTQVLIFLIPSFLMGNLMYLHRDILMRVHGSVPWLLLIVVAYPVPVLHRIIDLSPIVWAAFAVVWVGMAGFKAVPFRFPDISYGLYIYHFPLILFFIRQGMVNDAATMAMWLPVPLFAVCIASWYLVEERALKLKVAKKTELPNQEIASSLR